MITNIVAQITSRWKKVFTYLSGWLENWSLLKSFATTDRTMQGCRVQGAGRRRKFKQVTDYKWRDQFITVLSLGSTEVFNSLFQTLSREKLAKNGEFIKFSSFPLALVSYLFLNKLGVQNE